MTTIVTDSGESRRRKTLADWILINGKELVGKRKVEGNLGDQNLNPKFFIYRSTRRESGKIRFSGKNSLIHCSEGPAGKQV